MEELRTIKNIVRSILEDDAQSRSSDMRLYLKFVERINPSVTEMRFGFVIENLKEIGLPSFESIGRVRRKLQEENPELRANEVVTDARRHLENDYREFAKNG